MTNYIDILTTRVPEQSFYMLINVLVFKMHVIGDFTRKIIEVNDVILGGCVFKRHVSGKYNVFAT